MPEIKDLDKMIAHKFQRHIFLFNDMVVICKVNNPKKYSLKRRIYLQDLKIKKKMDGGHFVAILLSEDKQSCFSFTYIEALEAFIKHFELAIQTFEIDKNTLILSTKKQIEERYGVPTYTESTQSITSLKSEEKPNFRVSFKNALFITNKPIANRRRSTQQE